MQHSSDELNEIFQKMPEGIKDAIVSVDTARIINDTGKKYGLHIDQVGTVAEETGLVLLGLTHPTEFVSNLTKRLGIDRVVASQIASEINDQVFLKVREQLRNVHDNPEEVAPEDEPAPESLHPTRDALLEAIQNPEGMAKRPIAKEKPIPLVSIKNPYEKATPEMGKDFPVVAEAPKMAPTPPSKLNLDADDGDILTQKMSGQFSLPTVETKVKEVEPGQPMTTKKNDPYKEQV